MKSVAVYSIKGGVGKTAAAVNLAYAASREGVRTLLWDLDPQSSSTFYLRVRPKIKGGSKRLLKARGSLDTLIKGTNYYDFDLLPGALSNRKLDRLLDRSSDPVQQLTTILKGPRQFYDLLLIDCPPGITLLAETIFQVVDLLLVPTIPTTLSVRTLQQLDHFLARTKQAGKVRAFFSMIDRRKSLHRRIWTSRSDAEVRFLESWIPFSSVVEQMGLYRAPVARFAPRHPAAHAFNSLWQELLAELSGG